MALTCRGSATVYTSSAAAQMPPVSDVDGTEARSSPTTKPLSLGLGTRRENTVKSNAWDENEVLLEGEEL